MSELAGDAYPIRFFIAVKMRKGYYGLSVFLADRIGDLPKLHVVTDMIFKLSARLKRNGIYHEMIVNVIRVKMGGNNYFVICPPHPLCRFHTDTVHFGGSDLIQFLSLQILQKFHLSA